VSWKRRTGRRWLLSTAPTPRPPARSASGRPPRSSPQSWSACRCGTLEQHTTAHGSFTITVVTACRVVLRFARAQSYLHLTGFWAPQLVAGQNGILCGSRVIVWPWHCLHALQQAMHIHGEEAGVAGDDQAGPAEQCSVASSCSPAPAPLSQAEKVAGEDALQAVQSALGAAQADGTAAHGEAATLAAALDAAEKARAALEGDLALHVERHAAGMQVRSCLTLLQAK